MNIQVEHPETCVALATVEVDETRMEEARERAFREYSKLITVPGFRKGKAPRALVLPMLPEGAVDEHAEEIVTSVVYKALLEEANLEPYAPGSVDHVSKEEGKPLTIRFRIPLRPVITLGELDNLTARRQVAPVTDEMVQKRLDDMLDSQAVLTPSTDPAKDGDTVFADVETSIDGKVVQERRPGTFQVGTNMEEIDAVLRGASATDSVDTDITYPDDYPDPDYARKTVRFSLFVNHVLTPKRPEATDEWVVENKLGESLEALRQYLRAGLEAEANQTADEDVRSQLISQVVDRSKVEFPSDMLEQEINDQIASLTKDLEARGRTLDQYLASIRKSLTELREEMALVARRRLTNGLVLSRIVQNENMYLTKKDIDDEIAAMAARRNIKPGEMRRRLREQNQMEALEDALLDRRILDFLKSKAEITEVGAKPESEK